MSHDPKSLPIPTAIDVDEARGVTERPNRRQEKPLWRTLLEPLASLKLTVVLLALSIVLVFAGTLAQWRMDTHEAANRYFRVWIARVELGDLTPKNFFPDSYRVTEAWENAQRFNEQGNLTNFLSREIASKPAAEKIKEGESPSLPFPGGIPIGILMTLNLLAAHGLKFKVQARGARAWWGLATVIAGAIMLWWVVDKQQGEITSGISQDTQKYLWNGIAIGLAGLWALSGYALLTYAPEKKQQKIYTAIGGLVSLAAFVFVMYRISNDSPLLDPNNTRILWQLIQAEFAAVTLLVGCYLLFMKRAGVVLLHAGILLMMFNELLVYKTHVEWQMEIAEKRSNWHAKDIRNLELAIERDYVLEPISRKISIEPNGTQPVHQREVISIPWARLWDEDAKIPTGRLEDPQLPFDLEVVRFYKNAGTVVRNALPGEKLLATRGLGTIKTVDEQRPVTSGEGVDQSVAWITVYPKGKKEPLGTYMFHAGYGTNDLSEKVQLPGGGEPESFNVSLRYQRKYMPYTIDLHEVRKDDYLGSDIPRNYSSDISLIEAENNVKHDHHIRMNEPLRFKGQTMYQSSFDALHGPEILQDPKTGDWRLYDVTNDFQRENEKKIAKLTTLQIVSNKGWMLPYLCCMIVLTGMAYHFMSVAARYFSRYAREGFDPRTSLWSSLWAYLIPGMALVNLAAVKSAQAADNNASAKSKKKAKTKLRDATQFEVTTSQFDIHQEYRSPWPLVMTISFLLAFLGYTTYRAWPPKPYMTKEGEETRVVEDAPDLRGFGELPAVFRGRVKPLDTIARNSLSLISRQESFIDHRGQRQPAIKWLLDLWGDTENFKLHKIYYIENPELLKELGLPRRKSHLYSYDELSEKKVQTTLRNLVGAARAKDPLKLDTLDKRAVELDVRWRVPEELLLSYRDPDLSGLYYDPQTPPEQEKEAKLMTSIGHLQELARLEAITTKLPLLIPVPPQFRLREKLQQEAQDYYREAVTAIKTKAPHLAKELPDREVEKIWTHPVQPVAVASFLDQYATLNHPEQKVARNPYLALFKSLLHDYYQRDYGSFNQLLPEYRKSVISAFDAIQDTTDNKYNSSRFYSAEKVPFESWYNAWNPFAICMPFYIVAFVLALAGLIVGQRVLQPATYWLIWAIFLVHTTALGMRIYLSGHPPVTNLYSSALFIGWGMVLLALLLEGYARRGFGSIAASAAGFATLLISTSLYAETKDWSNTGGDTMGVMQAVLDTDFWLATHVVTVALGYATTALAGIFGGIYLVANTVSYLSTLVGGRPLARFNVSAEKELNRAIYGTICFAIIFSFVGTVLGGLWADDSWGRFWGWDPKENGALIIVLWNALVLHARWDGMLKERGLAVMALVGGIVTGWSWFGVNELGVGLHSYGFKDGMMLKLLLFAGGSGLIMLLGLIPRSPAPIAEVTVDEAKMA